MKAVSIDRDKFLKEFVVKFKNFLKNSPLLVSFVICESKCSLLLDDGSKEEFSLNYFISVKENVNNIKEYLLGKGVYPTFVCPSSDIEEIVEELCGSQKTDPVVSTIVNVDTNQQRIIVKDSCGHKTRAYVDIPVFFFLNQIKKLKTLEEKGLFYKKHLIREEVIYEV